MSSADVKVLTWGEIARYGFLLGFWLFSVAAAGSQSGTQSRAPPTSIEGTRFDGHRGKTRFKA